MKPIHQTIVVIVMLIMGIMMGCARVPSSPFGHTLEAQITPTVLFSQVIQDPQAHTGEMLKVGGEVLSAKRLPDRTEIMVLQLPLDDDSIPVAERTMSQGRFIATQTTFLDPATLPALTRLTIIGEVTGQATVPVDDQDQTYPVLAIKALQVWPAGPPGYLSYRPYPWSGYPYWGSYWGPGPYWSPYWSFPRLPYWYSRRHGGRRGRH